MTQPATDRDPYEAIETSGLFPLRTAKDLRTVSEMVMSGFDDFSVGEPETGRVHRNVPIEVAGYRTVKADIIEPVGAGPNPVMIYLHGGGWVAGTLDGYRQLARRFAEQGFVVVNVDWGLAPENIFPQGYDDCIAAIKWAVRNIAHYGGDPDQIVVAGDSAGGNLSAGIGVSEPDLPIKAVGLFYGVYDFEHMCTTPEMHAPGFLDDLHRAYLGPDGLHRLKDPRVGPIHAAEKMVPAYIAIGSDDGGITQSDDLAAALAKAGVDHEYLVLKDHPHGFLQLEMLPETLPAIKRISDWLKERASR